MAEDSYSYIELSTGTTHYRLDRVGESAPLLVLLHGATVPQWEFDLLRPLLHEAGFSTLALDLYGHGFSDRPAVAYDHALFTTQVLETLEALVPGEPVHLLGHSLGAAVAARVAVENRERVQSLVLAAPLLDFMAIMTGAGVLKLPGLGPFLTRRYLVPMLRRRRHRRYAGLGDGRYGERFDRQLAKPGFDRALQNMFAQDTLADQSAAYAALNAHRQRVLLLWGAEDAVLPAVQRERLRELLPEAGLEVVAGAEHSFLLTHPETVVARLVPFFRPTGHEA